MERIHVIIGVLIIAFVIIFTYNRQENAGSIGSAAYSAEAVQNIAKVYSDTSGTATFNNINVNGNIRGNVIGDLSGNNINAANINATNLNATQGLTSARLCDLGGQCLAVNNIQAKSNSFRGNVCNKDNGSPCIEIGTEGNLYMKHADGRVKTIFTF